jgi:serine/threonine protein kinase
MTCIPSTLPVPKQKPPIEDNYQRLNRLGSGSYGTVYLALRKHSKPTFFERVFQR